MMMRMTVRHLIPALFLTVILAAAQAKPADMAYNNGYQAGFKLGQGDKKAGEKQDFTLASAYRRATDGWKEGVSGDLEAYRTNYRNGFTDGYRDGVGDQNAGPGPAPAVAPPASPVQPPPEQMERQAPAPVQPVQPMQMAPAAAPRSAPGAMPASGNGPVSVPDGTIMRVRLNSTISTRSSRQGDTFVATVTEPVYLSGTSTVAIPAGSTVAGAITRVQRPGRVKGKAELHMRYDKLTMPGGGDYPMSATTSGIGDDKTGKVDESEGTVKGKSSHGKDAATIGGGAAGGAVIGGIAGGPVGAGVGAAIGAGVGLGGVLVTRGKEIDLPSGTVVQIKLLQSMEVTNPVRQ